ncbi:MAG TPA: cytochrome c biogenesis protein CcdA [Armatimonadota bacterium]|jgi:cytochrome c-type biogenesis protein
MDGLFIALTRAVEGTPLVALAAALLWGILSIVFSPCHLASIPLIVGVIAEQRALTTRRACWTATVFSLGILVTIAVVGVATSALGRMAGDLGGYANYVVAGIFFLVGLHLLDVIPMPFSGPGQIGMQRKGLLAAFFLGLIFGIALGPCTFAYMAPVLGVTFKVGASAPLYAAALLLAYGVGHCGVIAAAGTSTEVVQRYLQWNETSPGMRIVKKVCGALVLAGGLYLIYTAH